MSLHRSTVRCLQCKGAKIRCDRLMPSCTSCVKRKTDCWYVGGASRDHPAYLGSLQEQKSPVETQASVSFSRNIVVCMPCKDAKIRCDQRRPSCSSCVRRKKKCWYVGDLPHRDGRARKTTPVLRELCFVGERLGSLEMLLLSTYMAESSLVVRSPLCFTVPAKLPVPLNDSSTWATSMTPRQAASHATTWAAICVGAVLRRNDNVNVYFGNATLAARVCYDVPCWESLTAMITIAYAAYFISRIEEGNLFAGSVEILSAELPLDRTTEVQVRYIRGLKDIARLCNNATRIHISEEHHPDRGVGTPIQALTFANLGSMSTTKNLAAFQRPLPVAQLTVLKAEICKLERLLAVAMESRIIGDHAEIRIALTQLLLLNCLAGKTPELFIPLAKEVVEISCTHPMRLHTPQWHSLSIALSTYLFRLGQIETATKMWDHLNRFLPLNVGVLAPLASHTKMVPDITREGSVESDIQFVFVMTKPLM